MDSKMPTASLAFCASGCAFLQWSYLADREVDKSLTRGFEGKLRRKAKVRIAAKYWVSGLTHSVIYRGPGWT